MKTRNDPRHIARVEAVKKLFAIKFTKKTDLKDNKSLVFKVLAKQNEIDDLIVKNAPAWPIEQIAPIDLTVLRLAIYELLFKEKKEPYKVIVDEAVEIAKEYGNESSGSFINGVLGTIIKKQGKAEN